MRKLLLMSAATLGLAAGPVVAQTAPATPPVMSAAAPDAAPATRGMTGMRPLRGQQREAVGMHAGGTHQATAVPVKPGSAHRAPASQAQDAGIDAPRTGDYRGGTGSPSSTQASNIGRQDTRSDIAPRLPDPGAAASTPQALLQAAQRALASNRTGAAQEALERAETRVLTRSTDPGAAGTPDQGSMVQSIGAARRALAARDVPGARAAISAALAGS